MSQAPIALVTNDDGIGSRFLLELTSALVERFDVFVCAPDGERSWIGHAISRHQRLVPEAIEGMKCPAWQVNGTPADCVNLALGHLLPKKPDIVVSGINLGYNVTWPMILSSGTVGGALEGTLEGIPSVAVSMALPPEEFDDIRESQGEVRGDLLRSLRVTARKAALFAEELVRTSEEQEFVVHNLNFPEFSTEETTIMEVEPARIRLGSLFAPDETGGYQLFYRTEWLDEADPEPNTDLAALRQGQASHAKIDFSNSSSANG